MSRKIWRERALLSGISWRRCTIKSGSIQCWGIYRQRSLIGSVAEGHAETTNCLTAKMALQNYPYRGIMNLLKVSASFVSKWKSAFLASGVQRLRLTYQGAKG